MRALLFGASGGLATSLAETLLARGWYVDLVSRSARASKVEAKFAEAIQNGKARVLSVNDSYAEFQPTQSYDAYLFTQALFAPKPLAQMTAAAVEDEVAVGLTGPIALTRSIVTAHPPQAGERRDFCFIGSTSAYAGFKNTSVYCAVKHGLVGFIRAMNDEYNQTGARFWLFSMGTMNTEMGAALVDQDPTSFLQPGDVAARIVDSITSGSNVFEPEVLMRRRTIRFKEKQA